MRFSTFTNIQQVSPQATNKQKGFTLIELVVVIVILGILAVTAAPKFIDLTSDARESVMKGVKGSIESAVSMAQAKALIEGETGATGAIQIGGDFYALVNGYPAAVALGNGSTDVLGLGITSLVDLDVVADGGDFIITDASPALFQHNGAPVAATCQLSYAAAADNESRPVITETLTGC